MTSFGQMVRTYREQKGITLNEFANRLGVSAGYLSNLETGKTETIKLCVLEQLYQQLFITPTWETSSTDPVKQRLERTTRLFQECHEKNPSFTNHFLLQFEQSLDLIREA